MAQKENPLKIRCLLLALLLVLCCTGCAAPEKKVFEIKEMRLTLAARTNRSCQIR